MVTYMSPEQIKVGGEGAGKRGKCGAKVGKEVSLGAADSTGGEVSGECVFARG